MRSGAGKIRGFRNFDVGESGHLKHFLDFVDIIPPERKVLGYAEIEEVSDHLDAARPPVELSCPENATPVFVKYFNKRRFYGKEVEQKNAFLGHDCTDFPEYVVDARLSDMGQDVADTVNQVERP